MNTSVVLTLVKLNTAIILRWGGAPLNHNRKAKIKDSAKTSQWYLAEAATLERLTALSKLSLILMVTWPNKL